MTSLVVPKLRNGSEDGIDEIQSSHSEVTKKKAQCRSNDYV